MISRSASLVLVSALLAPLALTSIGCGSAPDSEDGSNAAATTTTAGADDSADAKKKSSENGQMSDDFRTWLHANGYDSYNFPRDDVAGGSFGGRTSAGQKLTHNPVVFVHGNADSALGVGGGSTLYTGFTASVDYFTTHGYTMAELYGTTWGNASELETANQEHSRAYVLGLRTFLQAVLAYTGASKVDVIAHSMGVTLARGAILGGKQIDSKGSYSIGASMGPSVDTFVGISGGNLGLTTCFYFTTTDTCSAVDGFYPGTDIFGTVSGLSTYLGKLNALAGGEGSYRYSIWSQADEVLGGEDLVWGTPTSEIPKETGEVVYDSYPYGHVGAKDLTGAVQLSLVTKHTATGLKKH